MSPWACFAGASRDESSGVQRLAQLEAEEPKEEQEPVLKTAPLYIFCIPWYDFKLVWNKQRKKNP